MSELILQLGYPETTPDLLGALQRALAAAPGGDGFSCAPEVVAPAQLQSFVQARLKTGEAVAAVVEPALQGDLAGFCSTLEPRARLAGCADALRRDEAGELEGHCLTALALRDALLRGSAGQVRTAMVLGSGTGARPVLAALRDLGCSRYLMGYLDPRRPAQLSSQFRALRRMMAFFPLAELTEFSAWAAANGAFLSTESMPAPVPQAPSRYRNDEHAIKRWDLMVNAINQPGTPGLESVVTNQNLLRCSNRILDLGSGPASELLRRAAQDAGVPLITRQEVLERFAELAVLYFSREPIPEAEIELPPAERQQGGSQRRGGAKQAQRKLTVKRRGRPERQ